MSEDAFQPQDLIHLHIPTQIGAVSLEPGVELDYFLSEAWHVYPYLKAGGTFASATPINAVLGCEDQYRDPKFHTADARVANTPAVNGFNRTILQNNPNGIAITKSGAVNVGLTAVALESVTFVPAVCVQA